MAIYQDDTTYNWRRILVDSAGNYSNCSTAQRYVTNPALAYNPIAVGNFNDRGSWSSPSGWIDDDVASDTCYADPLSTHADRY